eukprot:1919621-Amphidinium_carterae.1
MVGEIRHPFRPKSDPHIPNVYKTPHVFMIFHRVGTLAWDGGQKVGVGNCHSSGLSHEVLITLVVARGMRCLLLPLAVRKNIFTSSADFCHSSIKGSYLGMLYFHSIAYHLAIECLNANLPFALDVCFAYIHLIWTGSKWGCSVFGNARCMLLSSAG